MKPILIFVALLVVSTGAFAECPQDVGYVGAADMLPPCTESTTPKQPVAAPVGAKPDSQAEPHETVTGERDDKAAIHRQAIITNLPDGK